MGAYPEIIVVANDPAALAGLVSVASEIGGDIEAIYVGDKAQAAPALALGAKKVAAIAAKADQIFENYAATIAAEAKKKNAALLLLPADKRGKAMAAKLGAMLGWPVVNDAIAINEDCSLRRMVYGGLAQGLEKPAQNRAIATIAPKVVEMPQEAGGDVAELAFVEPVRPVILRERKPKAASSTDIGKAKRLVGAGRGFSKKDDLALARALADAIGAELARSRPIAEGERWLERERYIGVSGAMVKPDLYLATGISGQIQHMVGARDAKVIVAVNMDKNAPIFKFADYGIVGDLYKILPALAKALA